MNRTVIALGFFDGVHRGHGALLEKTAARARELEAVNFEMLLRDAEHLPDQKPASEAENPAAAAQ